MHGWVRLTILKFIISILITQH